MDDGARSIRRAGVGDAAALARLLHDFNTEYDDPAPPADVLAVRIRELLETGAILVLLAGDGPLGLAVVRLKPSLWSEAMDAYLEELYVVPASRGHGIGRALLDAVTEAAEESGADHLELTTGEADTAARALYESHGMTNHEGGPGGPRMLYYERDLSP